MKPTLDRIWDDPPAPMAECGHEISPLPTLDVIESEVCGAEDLHGVPYVLLDVWPEYGE